MVPQSSAMQPAPGSFELCRTERNACQVETGRQVARRRNPREADGTAVKLLKQFCKKGLWQEALDYWHQLRSSLHVPVDPHLLNWVFVACAKRQAWEHALLFLQELGRERLSTDIGFTTAINACNRAGQWEVGVTLLSELRSDSITPNAACLEIRHS